MKTYKILTGILLITLLITGCGKKEAVESKSIGQIHAEKGVPVKVEKIQKQNFSRYLTYSGKLKGIRQATEQSLVSGKIEDVSFNEGDFVKKGSVVVSFPDDLTGANYEAAKANYDVMSSTYLRMKNLFDEGAISQQEVDQVEAQYIAASSQLETVESMLRVEASISGYLTSVYVQETDHIDPGDLLFTISELSKLKSVINVTEKEIGYFSKGLKAKAIWEDNNYEGSVTSVGYAMNVRTGAFEVELEFDNPQNFMKFNINAEILIEVYNNPQAVVVQKKDMQRDSGGDYVFIANGNKAEKRYIQTGESSSISFEVLSGINEGELLITEGRNLLDDGSKISYK